MNLKVLNGARVLISTDGNKTLYIDTGREIIPVASQANTSVNVDSGEDGGYYIPNVNDVTGYVTWTPSKPNMPAVAPSVIRGPKGEDGRGVFGINFAIDAEGALAGGTVFYDDGSTSNITFSLSDA